MRTFTLDQRCRKSKTVYMFYEIQPTGPARGLASHSSRVRPKQRESNDTNHIPQLAVAHHIDSQMQMSSHAQDEYVYQ